MESILIGGSLINYTRPRQLETVLQYAYSTSIDFIFSVWLETSMTCKVLSLIFRKSSSMQNLQFRAMGNNGILIFRNI